MTPATANEIHRLAAEGLSQRQISEQVGCTRPAVARVLRTPAPPIAATATPAPAAPADLEEEVWGAAAPSPKAKPARVEAPPPEGAPVALTPQQATRAQLEAEAARDNRRGIAGLKAIGALKPSADGGRQPTTWNWQDRGPRKRSHVDAARSEFGELQRSIGRSRVI